VTEKSPDTWRPVLKRRLALTAGVMAIWSLVIVARLVYLQIFQFAALTALAKKATSRQVIPAKRGEIRDRNGDPLAWSMDAPSIYFDRNLISDPKATVDGICDALGSCSASDRDSYVRKINRTGSAVLKRNITKEQVARIEALKLPGIVITPESHRSYPHGPLAAHALGFVGAYGEGQGGVEKSFNSNITGQTGEVRFRRDVKRFVYDRVVLSEPTEGASLDLTIDKNIQHIVEQELKRGITENHADGGTAIVIAPSTGEVLAMASSPTFDPNVRPETGMDPARRNRAIQDTIEPGSMFKLVVATAALEQKVVTPESLIDVSGGRIKVGRYTIEDTHTHGTLSFQDVIAKSSNVGAIKVARLVGAEKFTEVARRLGFGRRTSIELFGESAGWIEEAEKLNDMALASEAIGYRVAVTPMQMVMAVNSIANGGELLRPRLLRAITRNGVRYETPKAVVNPTMTPKVIAQLTAMMEEVVEDGTATLARIAGYTVAGKTGTAEKLVDGDYSKSEHISSFVGFLPSRAPEYTIIVVIDSPHGPNGYFGGQVAAPIFKRIGEALVHRAGIPPTVNPPTPMLVRREAPRRDRTVSGPSERPAVVSAAGADGLMPDMTGLSAREAINEITRLGLSLRLEGVGLVREQSPAPGVPLESRTSVTLRLGQRPLLARTANVERR
jgi:cell division protein FtsI (penicillin-binding protein 3)